MSESTTKIRPAVPAKADHAFSIPTLGLGTVVGRSTKLSDEVLKALEASERTAVEAVGQFVISIEEALPQEVTASSDAAKKITESGLEMVDRVIHAQHDFLHRVIDGTAKSLRSHDSVGHHTAE